MSVRDEPDAEPATASLSALAQQHPRVFAWASLSVLLALSGLWLPTGSLGVLAALALCTRCCWLAAQRSAPARHRTWLVFTAGWFALTLNYCVLALISVFVHPIRAEFSGLQIANGIAIAVIGAALIRLISVNAVEANRRTLDFFTVSCGLGIMLWAIVLSQPDLYRAITRGGHIWWAFDETFSCVAYLNVCVVSWVFYYQDARRTPALITLVLGWCVTTAGFAAAVYYLTLNVLPGLQPFSLVFTAAPLLTAWVVLLGAVKPPDIPRRQGSQQPYLQHTALTLAAIGAIVLQLVNPQFDPISAFLLSVMMILVMVRSHVIISSHEKLMQQLQVHKLKLSAHAFEDDLTGLDNRRKFFTTVTGLLARKPPAPISIVYLDLDRFKDVNDTFGHQGGDQVLKNVAARLRAVAAGTSATIARLAGDEFTIATVHHGCNTGGQARELASRVHHALQQPHHVQGHTVSITGSVGLTITYPDDAPIDTAELIRQADVALYAVKASGRDAHQHYGAHLEKHEVVIPEQAPQLRLPQDDEATLPNRPRSTD